MSKAMWLSFCCLMALVIRPEGFRAKRRKRATSATGQSSGMRGKFIFSRRRGAQEDPLPSEPTPEPTCEVPIADWIYSRAWEAVNYTLLSAFSTMAEPLPLVMRNTDWELNLGLCKFRVKANTTNNISGFANNLVLQPFECRKNECILQGNNGCKTHRVTLGIHLDWDVLSGEGTDHSIWSCGAQLPVREFDYAYKLFDSSVDMDLVLDLSTGWGGIPEAVFKEVPRVKVKMGKGGNHHCIGRRRLVKPILDVFCKPMLSLVGHFFRYFYFMMVDTSVPKLINSVLTPHPDTPDAFIGTSNITKSAMKIAAAALGSIFLCCCCALLSPKSPISPFRRRPKKQGLAAVPQAQIH